MQQWAPAGPKAHWEDLAQEITGRDRALVLAHLPDFLVWLQDLNWPGAQRIADFLVGLGPPLLPPVRAILQGTDRMWQYWVLTRLIDRWPGDLVAHLEPELSALALLDTWDEVDVLALVQLIKHQVGDAPAVRRLVAYKRAVYHATPHLLDWLADTNTSA